MEKVRHPLGEGYATGTVTVNSRLVRQDGTEGYASFVQPAARGFTTPGPVPPLSRVRVTVPATVVAHSAPARPPCGACLTLVRATARPNLATTHGPQPLTGQSKNGLVQRQLYSRSLPPTGQPGLHNYAVHLRCQLTHVPIPASPFTLRLRSTLNAPTSARETTRTTPLSQP